MAEELSASLVLKLQDQLSGGLRKLQDQMEELADVADKLKLTGLENATEQAEALNTELTRTPGLLQRIGSMAKSVGEGFSAMGGAVRTMTAEIGNRIHGFTSRIHNFQEASSNFINRGLGAAAEGFVVYEPMKKYAEYENIVRHIGITEGRSGSDLAARTQYLQEFFRQDAIKTGQSSESVAQAYQDLVQMGIHENLDTIIQAHSRAATAYNTTAEALGPAVGALVQTMKIPAGELAATMSAMAQASKEGRFKIEDFSRELPGVSAQMALLGMTGRKAADTTFAALETVMRGSSQPGQAAVNLTDLLTYIRSPFAAKHFAKEGINLHNVLERGEHSGDVLGAVMDAVKDKVKGKDVVQSAEIFGKIFHNQQAGSAMATLLAQRAEFESLRAKLDQVNAGVVNRDFVSAFDAPQIQMQMMNESLVQLEERLGEGFLPILKYVNVALLDLNEFLKTAHDRYPKLTAAVLGGLAGLLALATVLGLIGAVAPIVSAGFGLITGALGVLFSPIVLVIAAIGAIAAAAYDIYANWGRFRAFFEEMWTGIKQVFQGFMIFLSGVFSLDFSAALDGIKLMAKGIATFFTGLWDTVKQVFMDFVHWVDGWAAGLATHILDGIKSGWSGLAGGLHQMFGGLSSDVDRAARLGALASAKTQTPGAANDNGGLASGAAGHVDIRVHAEPGTAVTAATATGPVNVQAPISAPSRGATVGRP